MQLIRVIRPHLALEVLLIIILLHFYVNMMAHVGWKCVEQYFTVMHFINICLNSHSPRILKSSDANCIDDAMCYFLWSPLLWRQRTKRSISNFFLTFFRGITVPVDVFAFWTTVLPLPWSICYQKGNSRHIDGFLCPSISHWRRWVCTMQ